jgi:hypothetical protein
MAIALGKFGALANHIKPSVFELFEIHNSFKLEQRYRCSKFASFLID